MLYINVLSFYRAVLHRRRMHRGCFSAMKLLEAFNASNMLNSRADFFFDFVINTFRCEQAEEPCKVSTFHALFAECCQIRHCWIAICTGSCQWSGWWSSNPAMVLLPPNTDSTDCDTIAARAFDPPLKGTFLVGGYRMCQRKGAQCLNALLSHRMCPMCVPCQMLFAFAMNSAIGSWQDLMCEPEVK